MATMKLPMEANQASSQRVIPAQIRQMIWSQLAFLAMTAVRPMMSQPRRQTVGALADLLRRCLWNRSLLFQKQRQADLLR